MEKTSVFKDLFAVIAFLVVTIIASILASILHRGQDIMYYYILMPIMASATFYMFYLTMSWCQGWKIFHYKMILGMPVRLFMNYLMVIIFLSLAAYYSKDYRVNDQEDVLRFKLLLFNLCIGTITSVMAWFPAVKNSTAKADEYRLRVELKHKGWTQEKIEEEIKKFKDLDLI